MLVWLVALHVTRAWNPDPAVSVSDGVDISDKVPGDLRGSATRTPRNGVDRGLEGTVNATGRLRASSEMKQKTPSRT